MTALKEELTPPSSHHPRLGVVAEITRRVASCTRQNHGGGADARLFDARATLTRAGFCLPSARRCLLRNRELDRIKESFPVWRPFRGLPLRAPLPEAIDICGPGTRAGGGPAPGTGWPAGGRSMPELLTVRNLVKHFPYGADHGRRRHGARRGRRLLSASGKRNLGSCESGCARPPIQHSPHQPTAGELVSGENILTLRRSGCGPAAHMQIVSKTRSDRSTRASPWSGSSRAAAQPMRTWTGGTRIRVQERSYVGLLPDT